MSAEEMRSSVETIEIEAEKILEEARSKANGILAKANDEISKIISSKLPMDEIKTECDRIIHKAREEADKNIKESQKKASEISTLTSKKTDKIIAHIVGIITGAESR